MLPDDDLKFLQSKNYAFEVSGNDVVITDFHLPDAYRPQTVSLLIRLPANYPEANPDMFFTRPVVKLVTTGNDPKSCGGRIQFRNEEWQQWSRHYPANTWRAMIDGLETYMASIHKELAKRE